MPPVTVTIDRAKFQQKKVKALKATAAHFLKVSNQAISSAIWEYPIAPSPRDIVDTGALLRSGRVVADGGSWSVVWDAPYAVWVHEGVSLKNGTKLPPRQWTKHALKQFDIYAYFAAVHAHS
jgi:hypothetical protein